MTDFKSPENEFAYASSFVLKLLIWPAGTSLFLASKNPWKRRLLKWPLRLMRRRLSLFVLGFFWKKICAGEMGSQVSWHLLVFRHFYNIIWTGEGRSRPWIMVYDSHWSYLRHYSKLSILLQPTLGRILNFYADPGTVDTKKLRKKQKTAENKEEMAARENKNGNWISFQCPVFSSLSTVHWSKG